jgi:hypothetical protein
MLENSHRMYSSVRINVAETALQKDTVYNIKEPPSFILCIKRGKTLKRFDM